jgi:hypothetical protein
MVNYKSEINNQKSSIRNQKSEIHVSQKRKVEIVTPFSYQLLEWTRSSKCIARSHVCQALPLFKANLTGISRYSCILRRNLADAFAK